MIPLNEFLTDKYYVVCMLTDEKVWNVKQWYGPYSQENADKHMIDIENEFKSQYDDEIKNDNRYSVKIWDETRLMRELRKNDINMSSQHLRQSAQSLKYYQFIYMKTLKQYINEDFKISHKIKNETRKIRVEWDVDDEEDLKNVPEIVEVPGDMEDEEITDYLTDEYGYSVSSWQDE